MKAKQHITFRRSQNVSEPMFHTYIANDEENNERLRIEIAPHTGSSITTLMVNIKKRPELNIVKKVPRFNHNDNTEMEELFNEAGMMTNKIRDAMEKITKACNVCASP